MKSVNVKKTDLLDKIKENRAMHRAIFEKALKGYRKAVVAELEFMLDEARKGRRIKRQIELIEPMDQTREYDRVVRMLEMSTDDIIELSQQDFAQYVMDDWAWKQQFLSTTLPYTQ
jgi:hypothetical protein